MEQNHSRDVLSHHLVCSKQELKQNNAGLNSTSKANQGKHSDSTHSYNLHFSLHFHAVIQHHIVQLLTSVIIIGGGKVGDRYIPLPRLKENEKREGNVPDINTEELKLLLKNYPSVLKTPGEYVKIFLDGLKISL
jgi:hypothetical protein